MPDKNQIIEHLQIIHTWAAFTFQDDPDFLEPKHLLKMMDWTDEALAWMKQWETVPVFCTDSKWKQMAMCGECKAKLRKADRFCPNCGRKVIWK